MKTKSEAAKLLKELVTWNEQRTYLPDKKIVVDDVKESNKELQDLKSTGNEIFTTEKYTLEEKKRAERMNRSIRIFNSSHIF